MQFMKVLSLMIFLVLIASCNKQEEEIYELDQMVQIEEERTSELAGPSEYEEIEPFRKGIILR